MFKDMFRYIKSLILPSLDDRFEKYNGLVKERNQVRQELDVMTNDYNQKIDIFKSLRTELDGELLLKLDEKVDGLKKEHLQTSSKLIAKSIGYEKHIERCLQNEDLLKAIDIYNYSIIKAKFKSREVNSGIFDMLIKSRQGVVKYSDFILNNEKGEVLLLKRSGLVDFEPNKWCLPGGHVDPGEDFKIASQRELLEETGIKVESCLKVGEYHSDADSVEIEYYEGILKDSNQEIVLLADEHTEFKWVMRNDLIKYDLIKNLRENLNKIYPFLNYAGAMIINKALEAGIIDSSILEKRIPHKYIDKIKDNKGKDRYIYEEAKIKEQIPEGIVNAEELVNRYLSNLEKDIEELFKKSSSIRKVEHKDGKVNVSYTPQALKTLKSQNKDKNVGELFNTEIGEHIDNIILTDDRDNYSPVKVVIKDGKMTAYPVKWNAANEGYDINLNNIPISSIKNLYFKLEYFDTEKEKFVKQYKRKIWKDVQDDIVSQVENNYKNSGVEHIEQSTINSTIGREVKRVIEYIKENKVQKTIDSDIEKGKPAQVGEEREWSGVKYKKTAQGWLPVKGDKKNKQDEEKESKPDKKTEEESGKGGEEKPIEDHAKESSETALNNAIKNATDPEVREAAHQELDRREKEEHVQEEVKQENKKEPVKEKKKDKSKKLSLDGKIKELSDKYKDLTAEHTELFNKWLVGEIGEDQKPEIDKIQKEYLEVSRYLIRAKNIKENADLFNKGKDFEDQKKEVQELLHLNSEEEFKSFLGDGDILALNHVGSSIDVLTEDMYCSRDFALDKDGEISFVEMEELLLNPDLDKAKGKGSEIFYNQIKAFKEKGSVLVKTYAAKSEIYNGYYTWARLGYNFSDSKDEDKFFFLIRDAEDEDVQKVTSLPELMSFKKGRDFWKEKGFSFDAKFDLSDDSQSMFILNKYIEEKQNGKGN